MAVSTLGLSIAFGVKGENYQIRRDVIARAARIEALAPNRSQVHAHPHAVRAISAEMESREPALAALRADVTLQERIDAYRHLFAMSVAMRDGVWR